MLDLLVKNLAAASNVSELENAKQVIEQSGFSDKETAPVLEQINVQIEALKAADNELDSILNRKDVKDAIQTKVNTAISESSETASKATEAKDSAESALKSNTIESIISYSLVLRKDSIDFENIESSLSGFQDELSSKDQAVLNDSLKELADEIKQKFSNSPSKSLGNEIIKENGQVPPDKTDSEDKDKDGKTAKDDDVRTMPQFLTTLLRPEQKSD